MFDRTWDRIMQNHHAMTGAHVPNMSLFDASWSMIMDKHEAMTAERDLRDCGSEAEQESDDIERETTVAGEMAAAMAAREEEAIAQVDVDEDRFALHTIHEEAVYEGEEAYEAEDPSDDTLYDKSWDRVMQRQHERLTLKHDGSLKGIKAQLAPPQSSTLQTWLLALCFGYMAYCCSCGIQRLVHDHQGRTLEPVDFDHFVSRICIFTTLTNNNLAKLSRSLLSTNHNNQESTS